MIVVIDDEKLQAELLTKSIKNHGYDVVSFTDPTEALKYIENNIVDIVITDWKMDKLTGKDVIDKVKEIDPLIKVIVVTAYGSIEKGVEAIKNGAYDYITKPVDVDILIQRVKNAISLTRMERDVKEVDKEIEIEGLVYKSFQMKEILSLVKKVAPTDVPVLIRGESGTGKELIANAIHKLSKRKNGPFVVFNAAALPETLIESELFGYEKGAFTGADKQKKGKVELANGGTLFLDEIGDIPPSLQVKLLRFLQSGEFDRLGGETTHKSNVRIISATNRNLDEMIKDGLFREDLYYRINVIEIKLPPLRQRREEIPLLLDYYLDIFSKEMNKNVKFSKDAYKILTRYNCPGNIRELKNLVQRLIIVDTDGLIDEDDIPSDIKKGVNVPYGVKVGKLNEAIKELEIKMIEDALKKANGVQTKAAELLGITERNLRYKMKKYGIK